MKPELEKQLCEKYPLITSMRENSRMPFQMFGFECGDGWYDIIDTMLSKLEPISQKAMEEHGEPIVLDQVKEKFAELRVYLSWHLDEMTPILEEAEKASIVTCEICGKPGRVVGKGWVSTRCTECSPDAP